MARNTKVRDAHRAAIRRGSPPCALCGEPIDYALRWPDPMCYVVDHKVALAQGGEDMLANKQAAHNRCNGVKLDRIDHGVLYRSGSLVLPA